MKYKVVCLFVQNSLVAHLESLDYLRVGLNKVIQTAKVDLNICDTNIML